MYRLAWLSNSGSFVSRRRLAACRALKRFNGDALVIEKQMSLLLVGTGHLSLYLGRIVFMWGGLSNLLKVRETQCVLMGHSLAPLLMMWGDWKQGPWIGTGGLLSCG